ADRGRRRSVGAPAHGASRGASRPDRVGDPAHGGRSMHGKLTLTFTLVAALLATAACSTPTSQGNGPTGDPGAAGGGSTTTQGGGGGGGGGGGASTVTDPCTLLTQAEVSTIVGKQ